MDITRAVFVSASAQVNDLLMHLSLIHGEKDKFRHCRRDVGTAELQAHVEIMQALLCERGRQLVAILQGIPVELLHQLFEEGISHWSAIDSQSCAESTVKARASCQLVAEVLGD